MKFKPTVNEVDLKPSINFEAIKEGREAGEKASAGLADAVLDGLTINTWDKANALLGESGDYELERIRRKLQEREYQELKPGSALMGELLGALGSGPVSYKGISTLLQAGSKANNVRRFYGGETQALYKTKKGKIENVKVEEVLPNGYVRINDGTRSFAVKKENLTARTSIKGDAPSNAAIGSVDGAAWGFSASDGGDRTDGAVLGAVAGGSIGRAIDIFTRRGSVGNVVGNRSAIDDRLDEEVLSFSDEFVDAARKQNDESLRAVQDLEEADRAVLGPIQPRQSYLDTFDNAVGSSLYQEKEGVWRSIREGYDKWLTGTSDFLMRRISPQIGAMAQRGDETAIRVIGNDVPQYVDPITKVLKLELDDNNFHGLLLDYAKGSSSKEEVLGYVRQRLGQQDADALDAHLQWADRKNAEHIKKVTGNDYAVRSYLHTQKIKKPNDNTPDFDYPTDPGLERRTRGDFKRGEVKAEEYQPVLATNLRRIMNNERLVQLAEKFGMPRSAGMKEPAQFFKAMERHFISKGIDPDLAKRGVDAIRENLIGQTRSPNQWLQALNSFGYATTLAGPKSALLNLQDPMVGSVKYGLGNVAKGLTQPKYSVTDRGIRQNVGEFLNAYNDAFADQRSAGKRVADAMRTGTDWLMKGSGFAAADAIGKGWTIKGILNHAADIAKRDGGLEDAWGFYFTKEELGQIRKQLLKHGADFNSYSGRAGELLEELAFAGLGQQQLISGMGMPIGWARHPNARPRWALRGFAVKQQALLMREVVDKIRVGKTDEALTYFARYVALAGGSFGLLNEARQWMFGDGEATVEGVVQGVADQVLSALTLNTVGLNDYQYGSIMQNGLLYTLAEGMIPIAADRPIEFAKGVYESAIAPEGEAAAPLIKQLPIANQGLNLIQNLGEDNLIPDPLKKLERDIRPGEQR